MRTRSGKVVYPGPNSTLMAHDNALGQQQPAQSGKATRASKRTRSPSDPSALDPETEPDSDYEHPASKTLWRRRRKERAVSSDIDVTSDNDLDLEATSDVTLQDPEPATGVSCHFARDMQAEHGTERVRAGRSGRRGGRSKHNARLTPPSLTTAHPQDVAKCFIDDVALPGPDAPSFQIPDRIPRVNKSDRDMWQETRDEAVAAAKTTAHSVQFMKRSVKADRNIMFTLQEAKLFLKRTREDGIPLTTPLYTVQTGEYVPYPVTRSYHLGAMGRYVPEAGPQKLAPRNRIRDSIDYVFDLGSHDGKRFSEVPRVYLETTFASPPLDRVLEERAGLGEGLQRYKPNHPHFATAAQSTQVNARHSTAQAQVPKQFRRNDSNDFVMRPSAFANVGRALAPATNGNTNTQTRPFDIEHSKLHFDPYFEPDNLRPYPDFLLPFGPFRGKPLSQVPLQYQKSLELDKQALKTHPGLKEALVEHYRFSWGKYQRTTIREVPSAYLKNLESNRDKVRDDEILQSALPVKNDRSGRSNKNPDENIERWHMLNRDNGAFEEEMAS
jgi:hypothetical protein